MASTFNLVRNSRVFFTTNVDQTTGAIITDGSSGITSDNTYELQVLDGFSFTQGTQQSIIQISEAGNIPVRGQRAFNTQLDPVDFSLSTYIRPFNDAGTVTAEEKWLWNALFSAKPIDDGLVLASTGITRADTATATATIAIGTEDLTAAGIAIGDTVGLGGFDASSTDVTEWEGPVKIVAVSPSVTAATELTVVYATAPAATAGLSPVPAPTALTLFTGAWMSQATTAGTQQHALAHTGASNVNQLQRFGMYFAVDNKIYAIDNCALDQASIDFSLDAIATIAWSGKGTHMRALPDTAKVSGYPGVFSGAGNSTGTARDKNTIANYITNKLSTMTLEQNIQGGGKAYNIALTGGNITIANNINYVVPANLGVVNQSIGYFTGTRSISGNVTAYLRTGANNSAEVLADILAANVAETKFKTVIEIGGRINPVHVDLEMNGTVLQIPTVETADVMSTTINFTAQGYDPANDVNGYDLEQTNDLTVSYYTT